MRSPRRVRSTSPTRHRPPGRGRRLVTPGCRPRRGTGPRDDGLCLLRALPVAPRGRLPMSPPPPPRIRRSSEPRNLRSSRDRSTRSTGDRSTGGRSRRALRRSISGPGTRARYPPRGPSVVRGTAGCRHHGSARSPMSRLRPRPMTRPRNRDPGPRFHVKHYVRTHRLRPSSRTAQRRPVSHSHRHSTNRVAFTVSDPIHHTAKEAT